MNKIMKGIIKLGHGALNWRYLSRSFNSYKLTWQAAAATRSTAMEAVLYGIKDAEEFWQKGKEDAERLREFSDKDTVVLDLGCGLGRLEKFLAPQCHAELLHFYKISDVYVLLSINRGENFGIAALEAMACGTPVVASALPGVMELVTDECGIKVKPKDIQGIADSINLLLADTNMRAKMGQAARKNVEKYSGRNVTGRVPKIYEETLKAKR
jgi:glycosyltransferase involved in cell wall biosynthesis